RTAAGDPAAARLHQPAGPRGRAEQLRPGAGPGLQPVQGAAAAGQELPRRDARLRRTDDLRRVPGVRPSLDPGRGGVVSDDLSDDPAGGTDDVPAEVGRTLDESLGEGADEGTGGGLM